MPPPARPGRIALLPSHATSAKEALFAAGLEAASGEILLFLDSDLGASAAQAGPLLEAVANRTAMSVAVFPKREGGGGFGLAKGLAAAVIRLFTGLSVAAPLSGQRAMPAALARTIGIAPRWGVEVALTVEVAHLGVPVIEQPVPLDHHHTGRDATGFRHRFAQFRSVLRYALGVGYGLNWPALTKKQVAVRVVLWLLGFSVLIGTARQSLLWLASALLLWLPCLWFSSVTLGCRKTNYPGPPDSRRGRAC